MPGSEDLQLPKEIRDGLLAHVEELEKAYRKRQYGGRVGFGKTPALIVIDLAKGWTDKNQLIGSNLDSVVENTVRVLKAARRAGIPIFFTVVAYSPDDPWGPWQVKKAGNRTALATNSRGTELEERLERRPSEKLIVKKYGSSFKGTDLADMLSSLGVDTLIVTGCSTLHCVHATCADAVSKVRVIVPREAVGDRCELFHLVGLLDINMSKGDVLPVDEVIRYLDGLKEDG